jgi:ABC-type molybdate transport system ATPase subunit
LFDDPFVTFDDARAGRALKMLKDMAHEFQVIFMTHSDRYDSVADNVVVLPEPVERDEPDPVTAAAAGEALSMWSSTTLESPAAASPVASLANGNGHSNGNGNGNGNSGTAAVAPTTTPAPATPVAPLWPEER